MARGAEISATSDTHDAPALLRGLKPFLYPVGLLAGSGVAVFGAVLATPHGGQFEQITSTSEFKLWRALIGIMLAIVLASNFVTVPMARAVWSRIRPGRRWPLIIAAVGFAVVAGPLLFVIPMLVGVHDTNAHSFVTEVRGGLATIFGILLALLLPAIFVIIGITDLVGSADAGPKTDEAPGKMDLPAIQSIRELRSMLTSALTWLAIPVSSIVIVTGQLRSALIAENSDAGGEYPIEYLLVYGAMFAATLGALYVPAISGLRKRSRVLADTAYPFDGTVDWEDNHSRLNDYLGLSNGFFENAKTLIGTLSPFIASVVAIAIP